ncbi:MAG TPA: sodium:solute symporter family protein [Bacteroides sp.]|nr:sodium:solute symporter family protein [Bacteroides sp.]
MTKWIILFSILYLGLLVYISLRSKKKVKSPVDYIFAGSNIGSALGFMTFAATLFSTFTLMGMPDFFRINGVGAWIFLAVSDGALVFLIVWFGFHLRKKVSEKEFSGISSLLQSSFGNKIAGYVYFAGVFIFLIPYVAIQIRGVSIFLHATFPAFLPVWGWALAIVVIMLIYSEIGGLKAIMYADSFQGLILLTVIWIIAMNCLRWFDGFENMFAAVEKANAALLSVPGPEGLFNVQFLVASLLVIMLIPVTQPQLTTRIVVMKNLKETHKMAIGVGIFANLIIFPTVILGYYGAVRYPTESTADFIAKVLLFDQPGIVAALAIIGLVAAALSTSDSQIFALGTEFRSLISGPDRKVMLRTRLAIIFFGIAALVFSILSSDELVMLARVSFAGTALLAPMIFTAVFSGKRSGPMIPVATFACLVIFISSLLGWIPDQLFHIRMDLLLLLFLGVFSLLVNLFSRNETNEK